MHRLDAVEEVAAFKRVAKRLIEISRDPRVHWSPHAKADAERIAHELLRQVGDVDDKREAGGAR